MDLPTNEQSKMEMDHQQSTFFEKLRCHGILINCRRIIPLVDNFSPLSTSFEAPIMAGETLYPSVEHHVAAQLLRDVQRLDAVRHVPMQLTRVQLRNYLRESLFNVSLTDIESWRRNRMYNALKAATELKFAQYPQMKALLIRTGDAFLFEVPVNEENEKSPTANEGDWSIGMKLDSLIDWMRAESISPLAFAFFTMHNVCNPGVVGSNMTGRLLMELRHQISEIRHEYDESDTLQCPKCETMENDASVSISDEIVILAGQTNPLSFDYSSTFVVEGRCYFNVEHFVKWKMLEEFGFSDSVDGCLTELDQRKPSFFKKLTDFLWERRPIGGISEESMENDGRKWPSISSLRRWARTRGIEFYETALKAKFTQNPHLLRALLASGDSLLIELRWGTGKSARAKFETGEYGAFLPAVDSWHVGDPTTFVKWVGKWRLNPSNLYHLFRAMNSGRSSISFIPNLGKNRLGMLLMEIREKFKSATTTITTMAAPSLHQFFSDFLLRLVEAENNRGPKSATHLQRVNSFIVKASTDRRCAAAISVDGRYNPLSIFYLAPFTADGLYFPTLEHYRWWKFFEHYSKFVQCVPGFWDHTDGRQLRAICEQWTNENLGLNASQLIERYRMDLEFDVLRNGALSKHSQNVHILPMLFDDVAYGPIIAGETEGDAFFSAGMTAIKMRRLIERWKITAENLTLWWTSLKCVKPTNMGDNLYGLALMSARDEIFAIYCERAVANIPMAPSVRNFNEITSDENFFVNDLESERIFIFSDDDRLLGLNSTTAVYLLKECYAAIGAKGEIVSDENEEEGCVWKIFNRAQERIDEEGLKKEYDDWFASVNAAETLKKAAESKVENDSEFRKALLATEKSLLIGTIKAEENENDEAECDGVKKALTIGLTEEELSDFLRDLRPPTTLTLQFWTRCRAVLPGRLGSNLWAACLMVARKTILGSVGEETAAAEEEESAFWKLDAIPEKVGNGGKKAIKKRPTTSWKERTETKLTPDTQTVNQIADGREGNEADNGDIYVLPPMPDALLKKNTTHDAEREIAAALEPTVEALRCCSSLFERVISSSETNEELNEFGERLGNQMLSIFGGCSPDLASFTNEDMYNLGRIASCQVNANANSNANGSQ